LLEAVELRDVEALLDIDELLDEALPLADPPLADEDDEPDGGFEPDVLPVWLLPLVDPDGGTELLEGIVLTDEEPGPSEELLGIKITVRSKEKYCKTCRNLPSIKTFWEVHPKTDI